MSMTDPIADLLTRIRNAHIAKHDRLDVPYSKTKLAICRILADQGFISGCELLGDDAEPGRQKVRIVLRSTSEGDPAIRRLARVSKPGRRVYRRADALKPVLNGLGVGIVSTSKGLLTDAEARERRVGGEVICEIW
ncbi:MAG: 30S ribosomal protein S8 [Thermoanaerobaculia bacterium]|nr:30S ribosomal protein S8 [Thermoanaerobaculia bacterium]